MARVGGALATRALWQALRPACAAQRGLAWGPPRARAAQRRAARPLRDAFRSLQSSAAPDALQGGYAARVAQGELMEDGQQAAVVVMLSGVLRQLAVAPAPQDEGGGGGVKGIYIHGSVGSGKSLLMDLFFATAREQLPHLSAKRVHFHDFMASVHAEIHAYKKKHSSLGAVKAVGAEMARGSRLLCFDEFQISDIADAAILSQLFEGIWEEGCCVIATSNRAPSELYKDGLNRHVYLPKFEKILRAHCAVHNINNKSTSAPAATTNSATPGQSAGDSAHGDKSGGGGGAAVSRDYRLLGKERAGVYIHPLGGEADAALDELFAALCGGREAPETIAVPPGRSMLVERCGERVARFEYEELFCRPIGPSDFGAVARRFDVVLVRGVRAFDLQTHNEARRFMNFVDIVYDSGCGLVLSAECAPDKLLVMVDEGQGGQFLDAEDHGRLSDQKNEVILKVRKEGGASSSSSTTYIGDTEWSSTGRIGVSLSALSAVRDVTFAKDRAISRLFEMRSEEFLRSRPRCAALVRALGM